MAGAADAIARAAERLAAADGLLITAGAGMGVDSGLPDFRGTQGFWRAYPALAAAGLRFEQIANPAHFARDPRLAWGFYGHRLNLYRATAPHEGFATLLRWAAGKPHGAFVFTSNVDGQFQAAGFADEAVAECHGSIHHLQCSLPCDGTIWPAADLVLDIDETACRLRSAVPLCPRCGRTARPNILMFGDGDWLDARSAAQEARLAAWRRRVSRPVVIELGAGTAIPTVRWFGERQGCPLIRVNPREHAVSRPADVAIPLGAREGLAAIAARMGAA